MSFKIYCIYDRMTNVFNWRKAIDPIQFYFTKVLDLYLMPKVINKSGYIVLFQPLEHSTEL